MEFGIFHEFPRRDEQTEAEAFDEGLRLVDDAERLGLDVMWLAELHFVPQRSVLASPLTLAAAIAARTARMKIGIAVQVLPLTHPLRLAEDTATIDHVSHGRLIMGVGRSGFARTYRAYGVPYDESRERFAEVLEVLRRAWGQPSFSFEGKYHRFDDLSLVPRPYQRPHPEIRVAATTPDTFPVMGQQGWPIFGAVRLGALTDLAPNVEAYRRAWRAAGHPGEGRLYMRIPMYLAPTREAALAEPEANFLAFYRSFGVALEKAAAEQGGAPLEFEQARHLQTVSYDEILREKVIVGTPEMAIERLRELKDRLGLDGILAELNCGAQIPAEGVRRSLRLLCQEVLPAFK